MGHYPSAWGPAHTVEPSDEEVQERHQGDCPAFMLDTEPLDRYDHECHGEGGHYKAKRQELPCVTPVGNAGHQEL